MERINVIVPVYRAQDFLDRCIQSIVEQTYQNLRIILVEDHSQDQSLEKCYQWEKRDSRIEVVALEQNGRAGNARNVGLDMIDYSSGYIAFVDADDFIHPRYFEYLYDMIQRTDADFSWVSVNNTFEKEGIDFSCVDFSKSYEEVIMTGKELLKREDLRIMYSMVWGKLWRASLWENVRFDRSYHYYEDGATTFKVIYGAQKIVVSDIKLYFYFYSENSNTRDSINELKLRDGLRTEEDKIEFYRNIQEPELLEMAYIAYLNTLLSMIRSSKGIVALRSLRKEALRLFRANYIRGVKNKQISRGQRVKYLLYRVCPDIQRIWIKVKMSIYGF